MKFWIDSSKVESPQKRVLDIESADEFLLESRTLLLSESQYIDYWLTNFLYVDLNRIDRIEEAATLKILKPIKENLQFHLTEIRAETSTRDLEYLTSKLSNQVDIGAAIIGHRFIAEGHTDELLKNIEFDKITYNAQKEILSLISKYTKNVNLVMEYYQKVKHSEHYDNSKFGITSNIYEQIENNEIGLAKALDLMSDFHLSDEEKFSLATSCGKSGNIDMYSDALNLISNESKQIWNLENFIGDSYFKLSESEKDKFITLLNSKRKSKGIKMNIELAELFQSNDISINDSLIEFYEKHKKLQPDDKIFSFLMYEKKYTKALLLIDKVQGRNRFAQYRICLKELLRKGDLDLVKEKIVQVKDNFTRSEIILELLEMNNEDEALLLNSKIFNKSKQIELTDKHLIVHYVKQKNKAEALRLLNRNKSTVSRIGIYHQLGRMCLGLKYGSTG
jgi:hypothetical protein